MTFKSTCCDHCVFLLGIAVAVPGLSSLGSANDKKTSPVPEFPSDVNIIQDISHLGLDRHEKANFYLPLTVTHTAKHPCVVLIHGGGFNGGDKARKREIEIGAFLARNGFAAFSINYKLWNKDARKPVWP